MQITRPGRAKIPLRARAGTRLTTFQRAGRLAPYTGIVPALAPAKLSPAGFSVSLSLCLPYHWLNGTMAIISGAGGGSGHVLVSGLATLEVCRRQRNRCHRPEITSAAGRICAGGFGVGGEGASWRLAWISFQPSPASASCRNS